MKKPFLEQLLRLAGLYWWPPVHNDPKVKGPQPRLVTRAQYEALRKRLDASGPEAGEGAAGSAERTAGPPVAGAFRANKKRLGMRKVSC